MLCCTIRAALYVVDECALGILLASSNVAVETPTCSWHSADFLLLQPPRRATSERDAKSLPLLFGGPGNRRKVLFGRWGHSTASRLKAFKRSPMFAEKHQYTFPSTAPKNVSLYCIVFSVKRNLCAATPAGALFASCSPPKSISWSISAVQSQQLRQSSYAGHLLLLASPSSALGIYYLLLLLFLCQYAHENGSLRPEHVG